MPTDDRPFLIVVNGHPSSGKTTLARQIADSLTLPLFTKDDFKEHLFEILGGANLEASRALGRAAWKLLYLSAETLLTARRSLIIEGNFYPESANSWIAATERRHEQLTVQIMLHADPHELVRRYSQRVGRHPAHMDSYRIADVAVAAASRSCALVVNGPTIKVDTTDFTAVDVPRLITQLRALTHHEPGSDSDPS